MAGPITWRNVGSTVSGGGSVAGLTAGTQGVRQALADIGNVIAQQQKVNVANAAIQREANTQSFLDQVASATLEQLNNPDYVANLNAQRDAAGMTLDRAATRDAILNQRATLQKAFQNDQVAKDLADSVAQRDQVDELRTLAARGDADVVNQILAERQFINEGELRKELTAVQDNLLNRQYRASGEARAEAAASRAAESHALSMTSGRENLAFQREQRAELLNQRQQNKTAESVASSVFQDFENSRKATNELLRQVGNDMGVPLGDDGLPDVSVLPPEQRQQFEEAVASSGAMANLSETDERAALAKQLREAGLSAEASKRAFAAWEVEKSFNRLAPEDKARAEATVAAANAGIDRVIGDRTREFERETARNPFVEPSKTPIEDVNKMVQALNKEGFGNQRDRRELSNRLVDLATNGITLKDGTTIVVPTSVLNNVLNSTERGWVWDSVDDFERQLENVLSNDGLREMADEAPVIRENFLKDLNSLNSQKLSNAVKVTRSAEAAKGVTMNPNDIVTNAIRRRQQ